MIATYTESRKPPLIVAENPQVVSERLGHSTIILTLDTYSHVLPTMPRGAAKKLEQLLYSEADGHRQVL